MRSALALAVLGAALGLGLIGLVLSPSASAAFKTIQDGMPAPVVEGRDLLTGAAVTSEAGSADEVVIVTFWATWSGRSLELLADLKTMTETYAGRPLRVIAVNVDGETISAETRAAVRRQVEDLALPYPVLMDDGLEIFYAYGVIAVPSTAILDAEGVLRYGPAGYSYAVRDRMVDTTETLLGIREAKVLAETLPEGHRPDLTASRYYYLGLRMAGQGLLERALDHVAHAAEADPEFSAPHRLRGEVFLEMERAGDAAGAFATAVSLDERSVAAWAGWGRALLAQGEAEAAREKLDRALELDESYVPALVDLARCRCEAGETRGAVDLLQRAIDLNPMALEPRAALARCRLRSGDRNGAAAAFREALQRAYPDPAGPGAR